MKIFNTIKQKLNRKSTGKAFYELSSGERKKIIEQAARKANDMQLALLREYDLKFGK